MNFNNKEKSLLKQWGCVFAHATKTEEYKLKNDLSFGVYQIEEELNTTTEIKDKKGKKKKVYNYPELNGDLNTLRVLLNNYYMDEIAPTLYKYELLK